jgi:5'-methylthioadenosine phosphorylase
MSKLGIIGGSGLYHIEGLESPEWIKIKTPFGDPSDEFLCAKLSGEDIVFLPRHGRGHRLLPCELNYPANIYGMKKLGVDMIISVSTVGSLKQEIKPLDIVIPDQYVDRTRGPRKTTFFGNGISAHIAFAEPSCPVLGKLLYEEAKLSGLPVRMGGTYINMEGPAFSTKAESNLYRSWGMDIIGMTNMPEAKCAREAEICYVTMAMVTDYDCWHGSEGVSIDMIIQNLLKNVENAKKILKGLISKLPRDRKCICASALKDAIVTSPDAITEEVKKRLDIIIGKYVR